MRHGSRPSTPSSSTPARPRSPSIWAGRDGVSNPGLGGSPSRKPIGGGSRHALCLWLPTFELRLELVRSPELDATSVALLSTEGGSRRTLWQVSERAHESGVRPGQLVSQAVSLCPSLTLLEPDPAHYDAAQEAVIEVLTDFSPIVDPGGPGVDVAPRDTDPASRRERGRVFLGVDGLGRLYGSPPNQIRRALLMLLRIFPASLVASIRSGYAPGRFGAWVAAAAAGPGRPVILSEERLTEFLARCPVSVLPVDEVVIRRLERLGVETLNELVELPEPALVGQFGDVGRVARAWATGERIDPVHPVRKPRSIRVKLDFPVPVGQTQTLHGALDRLLDRALSRPARRGRSVVGVRLAARLEGGGSWTLEHTLREPSSRREDIAFVLRSRMTLSPPTRAVETLGLEVFRFGPATHQSDLFDRSEAGGREAAGRELARGDVPRPLRRAVKELKLKLGHSPLYRVVEIDPWSRIPERRHALLSFDP